MAMAYNYKSDCKSDSAFCYLCMKVDHQEKILASTKRDAAFLSRAFTYWKEATTAFVKHQSSECHQEASEALILLPRQSQGDVGELLSQEHKEDQQEDGLEDPSEYQVSFLSRSGIEGSQ